MSAFYSELMSPVNRLLRFGCVVVEWCQKKDSLSPLYQRTPREKRKISPVRDYGRFGLAGGWRSTEAAMNPVAEDAREMEVLTPTMLPSEFMIGLPFNMESAEIVVSTTVAEPAVAGKMAATSPSAMRVTVFPDRAIMTSPRTACPVAIETGFQMIAFSVVDVAASRNAIPMSLSRFVTNARTCV